MTNIFLNRSASLISSKVLPAVLFLLAGGFHAYSQVQAEVQASSKVIVDDGYDHAEIAVTQWGGSHGLFFGSKINYKGSDHLWGNGNAEYAQPSGQYGYGAFSLGYIANGGTFGFYDGGMSTGINQPINWNPVMIFNRGGNVGIATGTPEARLHVNGEIKGNTYLRVGSMPSNPNGQFRVLGQDVIGAVTAESNRVAYVGVSGGYFGVSAYDYGANRDLPLSVNYGSDNTYINRNGGNVGIGTTTPTYKLSVNGDIGAKKVKVTQSGWADHVFEKDYTLPTLAEVEQFIQQHKHLPGIPSAKEVEKNGVDLGDTQVLLLQKIEELTLYTIQLQKQVEELRKENVEIKKSVSKQKIK
ncbi:hypothetical protein LZZ85_25810 [Terrimonas sp. NA20]|uniref:BZIP transcription factor n=1 Tax=Terrimonas ginsenosidimutans TaxID=2908004 RepID=A0ABS9KZC7_9BACT|nr:hypothetical protein [Terrimonas ginsenosidimutans]MCG2617744.1 hypothetical protein [Terrimonas ginsenosidimutans]